MVALKDEILTQEKGKLNYMSYPKNTERIKRILFYRDEDGRTFDWIAKKEGITMHVVRRIYHREKALISIAERKENNVTL